MFGFFKNKQKAGSNERDREAALALVEATLARLGGVAELSEERKVKLYFALTCMCSATLNANLGTKARPLIDHATVVLRNRVKNFKHVRWHTFFDPSPKLVDFSKSTFLAEAPLLKGSTMTSGITAYDTLMSAFGRNTMLWIFERKDTPLGIPHASNMLVCDIVLGDYRKVNSHDSISDDGIFLAKVMLGMIKVVIND